MSPKNALLKTAVGVLLVFSLSVSVSAETKQAAPRREVWSEILRRGGSDRVPALEGILSCAAAENSWSEYALAAEMRAVELAEASDGDRGEARIRELLRAIETAPAREAKILLETRLAHALAEFSSRVRASGDEANGERLRESAFAHCENVLAQEAFLKKIPVGDLASSLRITVLAPNVRAAAGGRRTENGREEDAGTPGIFSLHDTPEAELPTLYDFLARDACGLYLAAARVGLKLSPDTKTLLAGTREFADGVPAEERFNAAGARLVRLFRERERSHADDADKTALASATLDRILTVALVAANDADLNRSPDVLKTALSDPDFPAEDFESALKRFIEEYAELPISVKAAATLARLYAETERGREAFTTASRALEKFGDSPYAPMCEDVLRLLKTRTLAFSLFGRNGDSWRSSAPTKLFLRAKNLSRVRILAIPAERDAFLSDSLRRKFSADAGSGSAPADSPGAVELAFPLEKFDDFLEREHVVEIPAGTLAPGFYRVFFAADDEPFFARGDEILPVCVGDVAVFAKKSALGGDNVARVECDGTLRLRVADAVTGTPIEGAEIFVLRDTNAGVEPCGDVPAAKTDALGEAVLSGLTEEKSLVVLAECALPVGGNDDAGTETATHFAGLFAFRRDGAARKYADAPPLAAPADEAERAAAPRLSISGPEEPQILGGNVSAVVSGKTADGAPLAGAKIRWDVASLAFPKEVVARGEGVLGDDGTLRVSWRTSRRAVSARYRKSLTAAGFDLLESQQGRSYVVRAETTANGRTTRTKTEFTVLNSSRRLSLYSSVPIFFDNAVRVLPAGTDLPVVCRAFDVRTDGVPPRVRIEVFRLVEPESAELDREETSLLDEIPPLPDGEKVFSEETFASVKNRAEPPACVVPADRLPPGRYRIRVRGEDDFGHAVFDELEFAVIDPAAETTPIRKKIIFEKVPTHFCFDVGESVDFVYASALENARAFVEITDSDSRERLAAFYVDPGRGQRRISVPATEAMRGKTFSVLVAQTAGGELLVRNLNFAVSSGRSPFGEEGLATNLRPSRPHFLFRKTIRNRGDDLSERDVRFVPADWICRIPISRPAKKTPSGRRAR